MNNPFLWPDTTTLQAGRLWIGGCDTTALAEEYGTPLYLFDETTLRATMRAYRKAFAAAYPAECRIHYASKAFLNTAVAQIAAQESLGLDVVSAAELLTAQRAGLAAEHVHVHGNAKTADELLRALEYGVGAIVIDNRDEIARLAALTASRSTVQAVLLRIAPNVTGDTHAHISTGATDAKFGLPLDTLDAAVEQVLAAPGLRLIGLHAHIGSQLFEPEDLAEAVAVLVAQAARIRARYGVVIGEISPGGGLGVPYTADTPPADLGRYARTLAATLVEQCRVHGLTPLPRLTIEPGRSIVARAGVALYRVVARKPGYYLHIDGGMADNIRPALYGARYTALLANRAADPAGPPIHVAGRYCESGDVLLRDAPLGHAEPGDLLAVATSGAYTLSMASNYNLTPRPAVLLLTNGVARLIQRRETEADLLARDLWL
ncbi:MAG: diaminopimelate decarboxylase [Oscillochloris sp.]|nr:diaminopimelate decarboxylase [Oscillochloris sp.]